MYKILSKDELAHHGILGMQWGHRNGPPYPLGSGSHSASEKKAGWQKSLSTQGKSSAKKSKSSSIQVSNKQGDLALYLATIGLISLVEILPIAAMGIRENIRQKKAEKFKKECEARREAAKVDKKTGLKLKDTNVATKEDDCKRVNPGYNTGDIGANQNCTNCTAAYEMRRRGYEVEAKLKADGRNGVKFVKDLFNAKNHKISDMPEISKKNEDEILRYLNKYEPKADLGKNHELANKTIETLRQEPPNSRGQILIQWNRWGGHSMAYEITSDGKVQIVDAQIGKIYNEVQAKKLLAHGVHTQYQRLDNCKFDTKKIKEAVR